MRKLENLIGGVVVSLSLAGCVSSSDQPGPGNVGAVKDGQVVYPTNQEILDSLPNGWTWQEKGKWYRSPDNAMLWVDGVEMKSLCKHAVCAPGTDIHDYEILKHGSDRYSPQNLKK